MGWFGGRGRGDQPRPDDQPVDQSDSQPDDQSGDQPDDRPDDQPHHPPDDGPDDHDADHSNGRPDDPSGGRPDQPHDPRDGELPALNTAQALRFRAAAMQAFRRAGVETTYAAGMLHGVGGLRFPLANISRQAAGVAERDWPSLLGRHAEILVRAEADAQRAPTDATLEESLYLSLWQRDSLPWPVDLLIEVADDLVALPALDLPETVTTSGRTQQVAGWGGWERVRRTGLANLARLRAEEVITLGPEREPDSAVHLVAGGYFTASRLLVLERVLSQDLGIENPRHGALVVVPNRTLLGVHVLRSAAVFDAATGMLALAAGESEQPSGISAQLYYWRNGQVSRLSRAGTDGAPFVAVHGAFADALAELGLT